MPTDIEARNIDTAQRLLAWNKKHLVSGADLRKKDLAEFFAPEFVIKANERTYAGNYESYFEFLNEFRADIFSLEYAVQEFISGQNKVVIPLKASIQRNDGMCR